MSDDRTPHPLDKTALSMTPRQKVADVAHLALFQVQDERPEHLVLGVACLFATLTKRCGLDPHDLYLMGLKVLTSYEPNHRRTNDSLQSLQDFAGLRIMGQDVVMS